MFVVGPASAIFPSLATLIAPLMCTPPGAAMMIPKNDDSIATKSIMVLLRNSAQQLYHCAVNLCAISCNRNASPTMMIEYASDGKIPNCGLKSIVKAMVSANHAFPNSCTSIGENLIYSSKLCI